MADLSAGKPHVIAPKGIGPGFWTYTAVLTILNVIIAGWILFGPDALADAGLEQPRDRPCGRR